jgi:predicted component of type VI protein secretion system
MKIGLMVLSAGSAEGKTLAITGSQFVIGRDAQCNLRPASTMISKRHCAVLVKVGKVFLRDFDSTNGTFVNDHQVRGEVALKHNDIVRVGPLSFKVLIEAPGARTPPPPVKTPEQTDDLAAAALLSVDEESGLVSVIDSDTTEGEVPGGSTVTEIPVVEEPLNSSKGKTKLATDKKSPVGVAQDAAKALVDKVRHGRRK